MTSISPRDNHSARRTEDLAEPLESEVDGPVPAASVEEKPWKRISLWRSFIYLMIPVSILSLVSGSLALATQVSSAENVETVWFWFFFFDVGREINIPAWFSAGLWLSAGILAGYFARHASRHSNAWRLFSIVCVFFSIDETLELHERLDVIGNELSKHLPMQLGFTWVIPGAIIAVLIVLALLRMVLMLPRTARTGLFIAGVIFIGGGVGVESLSGMFIQGEALPWQFFLLTLVEETMEMTGIALTVASLVHLVAYQHSDNRSTAYRIADRAE